MNPKALWIWPGNAFYMQNSYAGFRYDFNMEKMPSSAPLEITADQSYRLHVNGRYVCRGPVRGYQHHWPFDEVDILPYLKNGHNWISVEAYNPGIGTFAYNHADRAGFLCSAEWDNGVQILSRIKDWTVFRNTAYAHDTARLSIQLGWQEEVDLRHDDRSWITAETGFRLPPQPDWCHPAEAVQGSLPWQALEHRSIPMLDEHEQAPAAEDLSAKLREEIMKLGFKRAAFEVEFGESRPGPNGADRIEFLFSANPGVPVRPLKEVASSGELSRVMLAVKTVLAEVDEIGTLVFDEIDANIGGETAVVVAGELHGLGTKKQILCISHLAQVAACADRHFSVVKTTTAEAAVSSIRVLSKKERIAELGRMLGGGAAAETHAKTLLED